jgi:NAD-dependent SIR2 family protein deacetylase
MTFKKGLFFLSLSFCLSLSCHATLLERPSTVDQEEMTQKTLSTPLDMRWFGRLRDLNTEISIAFERQDSNAAMQIEIEGEFPLTLEKYKDLFQLKKQDGNKTWLFFYGASTYPDINLIPPRLTLEEGMGVIYSPRELEKTHPINMNIDEIAQLIEAKKCIFYTGAGISSQIVPTMPQLMQRLGFSQQDKFIEVIDKALKNPDTLIQVMEEFYNACLYGKPTQAHIALKSILFQKNWGLITENLDLLHQRSGIKPLAHEGKDWIRKNVSIEDLKKIDYVIAIGLARDESGFLGWYKRHNPNAKIIALNLKRPSYLDDLDYFVEGDIQELLPHLQQKLEV